MAFGVGALRGVGDGLLGGGQLDNAGFAFGLSGKPARIEQQRFILPDLLAEPAIALRLPRLPFQSGELRRHCRHHVIEPPQILLRRGEFQLGLAPTRLHPRSAGGFLEEMAAFGRPRLDQRADPPLTDDRARRPAARGIGKQQLHVARPHLAAVGPPARPAAALDATHDFDVLAVVEGKGRVARAVVDRQRDFREITRPAAGGPAKDDVVHRAAAQSTRRILAHDPAERFGEIGLAAAVRPDNAGQTRADRHLCRVGEGFEADQAQPIDLHATVAWRLRF